jgi:hypothetical protein
MCPFLGCIFDNVDSNVVLDCGVEMGTGRYWDVLGLRWARITRRKHDTIRPVVLAWVPPASFSSL